MRVTGWNNGSHNPNGSGYGLRISKADRDRFFDRRWHSVLLELEKDQLVAVPITPSFWRRCTELRSGEIGHWLIKQDLAPWPKGNPPALVLEHLQGNQFAVRRSSC
ncbi:hypothetical protein [Nonomuraea coxensis]|uniref:hypothetical protein n=1 Tax=Nonomuraea coxensis TaxID=404386 RepID=UPI0012FBF9EA|nr:hypothetical protein [Nonomuraea coxensis]